MVDNKLQLDVVPGPCSAGDMVLLSMGETLARLRAVFGCNYELMTPKGVLVFKPQNQRSEIGFDERLAESVAVARHMSEGMDCEYEKMIEIVLVSDGWTWSELTFKSPAWMSDHREIPIEDVRKIEGLEWLCDSSLEIKLELSLPKEK
jgi:hypothetical protein